MLTGDAMLPGGGVCLSTGTGNASAHGFDATWGCLTDATGGEGAA